MKLIWTDPSLEDLRAVRDYIGRDSDAGMAVMSLWKMNHSIDLKKRNYTQTSAFKSSTLRADDLGAGAAESTQS